MAADRAIRFVIMLVERLDDLSRREPHRIALGDASGRSLSYEEWSSLSVRFGRRLATECDLRQFIALAFDATDWLEFAVAYIASLRAGLIPVPVNARASTDVTGRLRARGVRSVVAKRRRGEWTSKGFGVLPLPPSLVHTTTLPSSGEGSAKRHAAVAPDDVIHVLHTSGTVSAPVPVYVRYRDVWDTAEARTPDVLIFNEETRLLHSMAPSTAAGLHHLLVRPLRALHPVFSLGRFDPVHAARVVCERHISDLCLVPAMAALLVEDRHAIASMRSGHLRRVHIWGSFLYPDLADRLMAALPNVELFTSYGATEAGAQGIATRYDAAYPTAVGVLHDGFRVRIVDDEGGRVGPGTIGRVTIQAVEQVPWAATQTPAIDLGDLGFVDAQDRLHIVGRANDVFKCNGLTVSPLEVETVLRRHPLVEDAAVTAVDNGMGTLVVAAAVVRRTRALTADALRRFAAEEVSTHKAPTVVRFVRALPRNEMGKVVKSKLLPRLQPRDTRRRRGGLVTPTEQQLIETWKRVLGRADVGVADSFFELGGSSLQLAQVLAEIERTYLVVDRRRVIWSRTLREMARILDRARPAGTAAPRGSLDDRPHA